MRRYVVILGLALASLSGCSDDESDEKGFESSPVGPAISIECAETPRPPTVGDTEIDVVCERAQ
jgi:hypothetical protein